jgi:dTDP-6-deoxy-L-talose 4-dehydrogenase (NAD+)
MKILITGANGFLGSNITKLFIKNNFNILCISQNNNNLLPIINNIKFIKNIKNNYNDLESEILDFNPSIILHTAWYGGNKYEDVNHLDQYRINYELGLSLLQISNKLKNKSKFIGFGSFAEYGKISHRAKESQSDNPNTHYGMAKSSFKNISKLFCEQNNISWSWIRPCYVYGNGDVATRLIPSVITKLKNNEQITLNSCDTIIDYIHIDDFCSGVKNIIDYDLTGVYNICSGMEYNLKDILTFLESKTKNKIIFDATLDREYASKYICGSNEKLKSFTSWKPEKILNIELEKMLNER